MQATFNEVIIFVCFLLFIFLMLGIDLGIFNRRSHALGFREALTWTAIWVLVSVIFYFFLRIFGHQLHGLDTLEKIQANIDRFHHPIRITNMGLAEAKALYNHNLSLEYLSGYLIEYSLSADNVFVILMIFLSFNISNRYYKKVLFWGILGAIVMRFIFIFAVSALIQQFAWFLYLFGLLLVFLGGKMGWEFMIGKTDDRIDPHTHPVVRLVSKYFSVSAEDKGSRFWVVEKGKFFITPLFIVLVVIEFSDVLFAVDSVPAVFSVTQDPFIVFFSNIFAILGLRSLFFLITNVLNRFRFLKLGLAFLLAFIGVKMLARDLVNFDTRTSLYIIAFILVASILASDLYTRLKKKDR